MRVVNLPLEKTNINANTLLFKNIIIYKFIETTIVKFYFYFISFKSFKIYFIKYLFNFYFHFR